MNTTSLLWHRFYGTTYFCFCCLGAHVTQPPTSSYYSSENLSESSSSRRRRPSAPSRCTQSSPQRHPGAFSGSLFRPGTLPVHSGPPRRPPGALLGFLDRHHPRALRVGLGALPAHCEVFWTRHHPGALRVRPGTIPVRLGSLACSPPGADFICVLAPSRRTGAPAGRCRVVPDNLTSHTPERDVGGRGGELQTHLRT